MFHQEPSVSTIKYTVAPLLNWYKPRSRRPMKENNEGILNVRDTFVMNI